MSPRLRLPRFDRTARPATTAAEAAESAAVSEATEPISTPTEQTPTEPMVVRLAAKEEAPAPAQVSAPAETPALTEPPPSTETPALIEPPAPQPDVEAPAPTGPEAPDPGSAGDGLAKLAEYPRAVLSWVAKDGYPINVDVEIEVKPAEGTVRFGEPAGFRIPPGTLVAITGSHIHALPGGGFDQRRHVTVWGAALARPRGRFAVSPARVWAWDEFDMPMPAAYERSLPKARHYFDALSAERGGYVRPTPPRGPLILRATQAPLLGAAFAPVLLGLAVAARVGVFDIVTAVITLVAASAVHVGLTAAAGDANRPLAKVSGGSEMLQNSPVTMRAISVPAFGCYGVAATLGVALLILRGSPALAAISALGVFIGVAYKLPPFKLVYRGLGEVFAAIVFGPVMLLGTYVIQSRGSLSIEAFLVSVPVALLAAAILFVNEIPDRAGDAHAGKRTLPVRWSKAAVIGGFNVAAGGAFVTVAAGVGVGLLPVPALLVILAIPLAMRVHSGLDRFYDNPYLLMDTMSANIRLHLSVGLLLFGGYLFTIADQMFLGRRPFLW
jgi:1,4-dihydroxy-2-naphthoate octaprenyltransferase